MDNAMYTGDDRRDFKCSEGRRLTALEHSVDGNGQEGMKTRLVRVEEKLDTLIKGKINWYNIVGIVLSILVLGIMALSYIRGIPL